MTEPRINEDCIRRFEAAWAAGAPISMEHCLPPRDDPSFEPTLVELAHVQLELGWKKAACSGDGPHVEDFWERFPLLRELPRAWELVQAEFDLRQRFAERPTVDEFRRRFPQWIVTGRELAGQPNDSGPHDVQRVPGESTDPGSLPTLPPPAGHVLIETAPLPDGQVERYTLSRLHAEGGLGRVWIARDTNLNREVALKELRPEPAIHPEAWSRFLKEAQITGQLEHPNIVPVYELGRRPEDQQPFYTMRFVRGQTLRSACVAYHQRLAGGPHDALELRRLLTAFVSVCNAIAYAHSRGVIHRDLKPENVILGGFGEVLVLDWGLAKLAGTDEPTADAVTATANPGVTTQGNVLGTPSYMAPEQAAGAIDQIDARTDIYGLGAILFEILTGQPPQQGQTLSELLRRIIQEPTPRARERDRRAPPALDAICARAMAKRPEDRYPDAARLADDVQRHLADEPVTALRESLASRCGRWFRRHRAWARAGALALLSVAMVSTVAAVLIQNARNETERHLQTVSRQRDEIESERNRALRNFALAQQAIEDYLTTVAENPELDAGTLQPLRRHLLQSALAFYREFSAQQTDDPSIQVELANGWTRVAFISDAIGSPEDVVTALREAVVILERRRDTVPTDEEAGAMLAESYANLGDSLSDQGHAKEAETAIETSIRLSREMLERHPEDPQNIWGLGSGLHLLANAQRNAGHVAESDSNYLEAIRCLDRSVQALPDSPECRRQLAFALANYAELLDMIGHDQKSLDYRLRALALRRSLADEQGEPEDLSSLASTMADLGVVLIGMNKHDEARQSLETSLSILSELIEQHPTAPSYLEIYSLTATKLGGALAELNRWDEARKRHDESVATSRKLLDRWPENPNAADHVATALLGRAATALLQDQEDSVLRDTEEAVRMLTPIVSANPDFALYLNHLTQANNLLASVLLSQGAVDRGESALRSAVESGRKLVRNHPANMEFLLNLASMLNSQAVLELNRNSVEAALPLLDEAERLVDEARTGMSASLATAARSATLRLRGQALLRSNDLDAALEQFRLAAQSARVQLDSNPNDARLRRGANVAFSEWADALRLIHRWEAAIDTTRQRAELWAEAPEELYEVAVEMARAASFVNFDKSVAAPERQRLAKSMSGETVVMLKQAVAAGLQNVGRLESDPDLVTVRTDPRFQEVLNAASTPQK